MHKNRANFPKFNNINNWRVTVRGYLSKILATSGFGGLPLMTSILNLVFDVIRIVKWCDYQEN